jgi:hypothetical protein
LSAECETHNEGGPVWRIVNGDRAISIEFDSAARVELFKGSTNPLLGWESPGYGRKHSSPTFRVTAGDNRSCRLRTRIMWEAGPR